MTWQELRDKWLPDYDPIFKDTGIVKGNIVGHQFTGDRCLLPGGYQDILGLTRKAMDVSIFQRSFMGQLGEVPSGSIKPLVIKPPVVKPPVVKPPVAKPPVVKPPVTTPPVAKPPVIPVPVPVGTPYICLGTHLWVRDQPNETTARLIDSLTKDQRVNVLEIQGDWARLEKPAGWVRLSFMDQLGEVPSGPIEPPVTKPPVIPVPVPVGTPYIFLGAHLWVRDQPNETTARLIDSLTKDQRVNVLEIQGDWTRLEKPAGWVRLSWLTKL